MKRHLSGIILLAALGIMLLSGGAVLLAEGRLFPPPPADIPYAASAPSDLYRAEGDRVRVDINKASEDVLCLLPGIGEALSSAIVACRLENGPYQTVEDLLSVYGIGQAKLDAIRPYIFAGSG